MFTPGEFLYLDQQDVIDADGLNMPRAIERVEMAVSLMHAGDAVDPPKSVLRWSEDPDMEAVRGRVNFLSAYLGGDINALGMKWVGSYPTNRASGLPRATALIILNDPASGFPIALMEASVISAMRTGAISGIAAKYLARRDAAIVGIIGTGVQSRTQLLALSSVLPELAEVRVYNRTRANAERFVAEMEARTGRPITIVDRPEAAVRGADVALVATTANVPLIRGAWLAPGMLTIQFSGDECDHEVIRGADKLVCDDWEAVKHRGITTPAVMHGLGLLDDADVHANLGDIVNGAKPGRESTDERIHFAAIGMGISDVALASMVYETAVAKGIGTTLKLWEEPLWV
jgi:2,3-diaminopropionate biosynthesis protein SbnB